MKTCNGWLNCAFKMLTTGSTIGFECKYEGYCDYQAPRDSRFKNPENKEVA